MALNSVNTNTGAMIALQNLQSTNSELSTVQNRISTGKSVSSAKDNGAIWAIAQGQRAEIGALNAVKDSLNRGQSAVDVALSAGESVADLLIQMKEKALAATDTSLTTSARAALNEDFKSIRDQITTVVDNASFNGVNLLDGSSSAGFKALANTTGANISVASEDFSLSGSVVTIAADAGLIGSGSGSAGVSALSNATASLAAVNASIENVSASLARLGTGAKSFQTHLTFVGKLQDTLDAGVGNLVDADLAKESARLQALQTKQQLGVQALSIANSSTSILLGLFR
ncbi:flagellin [Brevundimonas sp. Root1423]|uniref:flagellin n=1 Tax=Brevundimonas sp. Root1423 TaxID=1736462 RepID=UPI00070008FF|nr:flagellin [Brevundimonas sp. Root1423]KQY84625.1 flagellin [Brevundimonas sp. Root1423]